MSLRIIPLTAAALALITALPLVPAWSCPFCSSVSQTLSEEIASMDVVVIGRLLEHKSVPAGSAPGAADVTESKFEVLEVIKGDRWTKPSATVEALYYGDGKRDEVFLLMGSNPPKTVWSAPTRLSPRARRYVSQIRKLPKGPERLEFFQDYLEDEDEMLNLDAYDEFARTPYSGVIALKDKMKHDELVAWITDPEVPASRRRLYLTMLGVCGTAEDAPLLEKMLRSDDRKVKAGLDAMIACYLILTQSAGVPLVEELFLANKDAEYADTYSAIMALRFHGAEVSVIPKTRLLEALRHLLDRPELADLVIPDLARWQDWSVMPRLVRLFKEADDQSSWVRVPVINYLRSCPLPEAKARIEELAKIDPEAVQRAQTFFPFGKAPASGPSGDDQNTTSSSPAAGGDDQPVAVAAADTPGDGDAPPTAPADRTSVASSGAKQDQASQSGAAAQDNQGDVAAGNAPSSDDDAAEPTAAPGVISASGPNLRWLLGVPLLSGVILLGVLWLILCGTSRSPIS